MRPLLSLLGIVWYCLVLVRMWICTSIHAGTVLPFTPSTLGCHSSRGDVVALLSSRGWRDGGSSNTVASTQPTHCPVYCNVDCEDYDDGTMQ